MIFNVGDSRLYLFEHKVLTQITVDHSVVQELVSAGLITSVDAESHPDSNVVTRAVGFNSEPVPDFWLVPVIAVVLCAFYAAKAAAHISEAKFLGDAKTPPPVRVNPTAPVEPRVARHVKDGVQLNQRNMFCSDCTPSVAVVTAPSQVPLTGLALQLVATNVSQDSTLSFASVVNSETQFQGGYRVGDKIPGAGPVKTTVTPAPSSRRAVPND